MLPHFSGESEKYKARLLAEGNATDAKERFTGEATSHPQAQRRASMWATSL